MTADTTATTLVHRLEDLARDRGDALAYVFLADGEREQARIDYAGPCSRG